MARKKKSHKKLVITAVIVALVIVAILAALYFYFFVVKKYDFKQFFENLFPTQCTEHIDESPKDTKCDICGEDVPCTSHIDESPKDSKCDICGEDVPCISHVDETPNDGKCDICGTTVETTPVEPSQPTGELSIHFLELGNKYAGDCTLIKIGDTEVLIDAGSQKGSAETIVPYIEQYCTDGILEYVIATHAHMDHIGAFVGTKASPGVFDSFVCQTIIDFPLTDRKTEILQDYYAKRDAEVTGGATHYTALQCYNETEGAKRSYELADGVSMNILYNYYYENSSSDENNYSVCMLLTQGDYNYLFTGDLEEEGEERLVENNDLPRCKLYKGGHHGSKTSSTEALLSVIQPEVVCVCCCAGAPEYTTNPDNVFPTQDFVNRVAKYTDKIYVTTLATDVDLANEKWNFTSMNGNIVVRSNGVDFTLSFSNNDTILKETDWFKANRTWPSDGVGAAP